MERAVGAAGEAGIRGASRICVLVRRLFPLAVALAAGLLALQSCAPHFLEAGPATPSPSVVAAPAGVVATSLPTLKPIPDGYRIQIPRLRIHLPIAEGVIQRDIDQQRTPEGFAFHLPGTSIPGEPGNTYLYSHARVGMFLSLWNAKVGDEVFVSTPDGRTLTYVIGEVRAKVPPSDTSVVQPT